MAKRIVVARSWLADGQEQSGDCAAYDLYDPALLAVMPAEGEQPFADYCDPTSGYGPRLSQAAAQRHSR